MKDWKDLLETAIEILEKAGIKAEDWTFGGGTALMLYFHHRKSKDIDIFLSNPLKKRFQHIKSKEKEINLSDLQLEKPVNLEEIFRTFEAFLSEFNNGDIPKTKKSRSRKP